MKSMLHKALALAALLAVFTSCGNNQTADAGDTKSSDTTAAHNTNTGMDTTMNGRMENNSSGNSLMSAMNSMMNKMHGMTMTGDFDADWAAMMIEHHQGAIDMAQAEVAQGKEDKMKAKAQEIIQKQKDEQQQLRDVVSNYKASGMKHGEGELQKAMAAMMDKMKGMQMSSDVDKDFAAMMTSRHEDGISMARLELKNGMSEKLKSLAQKSIAEQQKDIAAFKSWMARHK